MTLEEFIEKFADEFDNTPAEKFTPSTNYRELEEWGSLVALAIISMIDDEMDVQITGADLRAAKTIEDLYNIVSAK